MHLPARSALRSRRCEDELAIRRHGYAMGMISNRETLTRYQCWKPCACIDRICSQGGSPEARNDVQELSVGIHDRGMGVSFGRRITGHIGRSGVGHGGKTA